MTGYILQDFGKKLLVCHWLLVRTPSFVTVDGIILTASLLLAIIKMTVPNENQLCH